MRRIRLSIGCLPHNGNAHNLRAPLKRFRREYRFRRQTAQAVHALLRKEEIVDGEVGDGLVRNRQVQALVTQRRTQALPQDRRFRSRRRSKAAPGYAVDEDSRTDRRLAKASRPPSWARLSRPKRRTESRGDGRGGKEVRERRAPNGPTLVDSAGHRRFEGPPRPTLVLQALSQGRREYSSVGNGEKSFPNS